MKHFKKIALFAGISVSLYGMNSFQGIDWSFWPSAEYLAETYDKDDLMYALSEIKTKLMFHMHGKNEESTLKKRLRILNQAVDIWYVLHESDN